MSSEVRILVVDDNHSIVKLLELVLQRAGFVVLTAFDGLDGYTKARAEKPDLILLDVVMPRMNGYDVCRRLQSLQDTVRTPIVFLTAKGRVKGVINRTKKRVLDDHIQERIDGFDAGATEFLSKPIVAKEVVDKVRLILN